MAYFAPNQPDFNFLRHLEIITWEPDSKISREELKYYVAHINPKGKPDGWFYDSFLIISGRAPSGNMLYYDFNMGTTRCGGGDFFAVPSPNPATADDWSDYMDSLFSKDGLVARLDECIAGMKTAMKGAPPFKRNLVISIPYPHHNQARFGKAGGRQTGLNFSIIGQNLMQASEQRLEACRWFSEEAAARFKKGRFANLNLLGFYWIYESLHYSWDVDDHWVIKELYKHLRSGGMRFFWIPFFSTYNITIMSNSPELYFDCAFLQPNHIFYPWLKDVKTAAEAARARGGGIEMEYYLDIDQNVGVGREKYKRVKNYLDGGVEFGYMKDSACAWFTGVNDMHRMARHKDPRERKVYDDFYRFAIGEYDAK